MEYVIAIFLTLFVVWAIIKKTKKIVLKSVNSVRYSQSATHSRLKHFSPNITVNKQKLMSQSDKHIKNNMIKIIVIEGKAYWVSENMFYVAEMDHGNIISDTVQQIDTLKMSKEELDKMLVILDNLKGEGE